VRRTKSGRGGTGPIPHSWIPHSWRGSQFPQHFNVALDLHTARLRRGRRVRGNSLSDGRGNGVGIVLQKIVGESLRVAPLSADQAPDQPTIGRIQLLDARFLLNDLRAIHAETRLRRAE